VPGLAHPPHVQRADDIAPYPQWHDDERLDLHGRAGNEVGARVEMSVVDALRGSMCQHPSGDPAIHGLSRAQDEGGEAVARKHGPQHSGRGVEAIDGEVVVRDQGLERVGDELEHADRVDVREQLLVDLEEPPLAQKVLLQLVLLAIDMSRPTDARHPLAQECRVHGHYGEVLTAEQLASLQDERIVRDATSHQWQDQPSRRARPGRHGPDL